MRKRCLFSGGKVDLQNRNEADVNLEDYSALLPLSLDPPNKLPSGDEPTTTNVTSTRGFPKLEAKRKEENG